MLRVDRRCLTVVRRSLMAVWPQEGCALLLGTGHSNLSLQLETVWPACNRWGADGVELPWLSTLDGDRCSNFALDPLEQLAAQRWARARNQVCFGVAHSHPRSDARPSTADRLRAASDQLMLILAADGDLKAWWLGEDRQVRPVLIDVQ